jgi:hypothetical protein
LAKEFEVLFSKPFGRCPHPFDLGVQKYAGKRWFGAAAGGFSGSGRGAGDRRLRADGAGQAVSRPCTVEDILGLGVGLEEKGEVGGE